jgi:hypothetical protein
MSSAAAVVLLPQHPMAAMMPQGQLVLQHLGKLGLASLVPQLQKPFFPPHWKQLPVDPAYLVYSLVYPFLSISDWHSLKQVNKGCSIALRRNDWHKFLIFLPRETKGFSVYFEYLESSSSGAYPLPFDLIKRWAILSILNVRFFQSQGEGFKVVCDCIASALVHMTRSCA